MNTHPGESPPMASEDNLAKTTLRMNHQVTAELSENDRDSSDIAVELSGKEPAGPVPQNDLEDTKAPGTPLSANSSHDVDSDDEFITSGEDDGLDITDGSDLHHHRLNIGSGIAEHTAFFEKSLSEALDLVSLDSSLVLQAQLSGQLNDKAKLLAEKNAEILNRLQALRKLHKEYIGANKIGELEKDIDRLASRIRTLKHGQSSGTLFRKKSSVGVVERFPIEYNQARDKVLERSSD